MENIISKELLSEVLKEYLHLNSKGYDFINIENNMLEYGIEFSFKREINIHELAHKCKEWAYNKKYHLIESRLSLGNSGVSQVAKDGFSEYEEIFHENSEPKAIFKACQWILDNKAKK